MYPADIRNMPTPYRPGHSIAPSNHIEQIRIDLHEPRECDTILRRLIVPQVADPAALRFYCLWKPFCLLLVRSKARCDQSDQNRRGKRWLWFLAKYEWNEGLHLVRRRSGPVVIVSNFQKPSQQELKVVLKLNLRG